MGVRPGGRFLEGAGAAARQARVRGGRGSRRQDLRDRRRHDGGRVQGLRSSRSSDLVRVLSTNDVYDPATNKWESRKPMAVPRNHAFGGAVNGKIYVIGGRTGHGFILSATNTDVVEEYNPVNDIVECSEGADADGPQRRRLGHRRPQDLRGRRRGDDQAARRRVSSASRRTTRRPIPGPRCPPCRCRVTASRAR